MKTISGIEAHCAFDKEVDVVDLIPHPRNPNKHDDRQIGLLAKIIRNQGWRNPIVVSERSGFIVPGHGRLEAAKVLNVEQVPVDSQAFTNEAEEYAHLIADNRIAELAEASRDELAELIRELEGKIDLDLTGFDAPSLAELLGEAEGSDVDAEPQNDKADELKAKWKTQTGQLWELGEHRLLCGDSTEAKDVERVLDGAKPEIMVTDPPYGVNYDPTWRAERGVSKNTAKMGKVQNDHIADWSPAWWEQTFMADGVSSKSPVARGTSSRFHQRDFAARHSGTTTMLIMTSTANNGCLRSGRAASTEIWLIASIASTPATPAAPRPRLPHRSLRIRAAQSRAARLRTAQRHPPAFT